MNKDYYKSLSFDQLRDVYEDFLTKSNRYSKNTINTIRSDTFYIWRHGDHCLFWKAVEQDDTVAKSILRRLLVLNSSNSSEKNMQAYLNHIKRFRSFLSEGTISIVSLENAKRNDFPNIPKPSPEQLQHYLSKWETLEKYKWQETALSYLFHDLVPENKTLEEILLKVSTLNDFYSTNIFNTFEVAKHIKNLDIDKRLQSGDITLVGDIQKIKISGNEKNFYSFATKYCSHHNSRAFAIYDSYVDRVLKHFKKIDGFSEFKNSDLKNYSHFIKILLDFKTYYKLDTYTFKEIDKYLWQLGKIYFPKKY